MREGIVFLVCLLVVIQPAGATLLSPADSDGVQAVRSSAEPYEMILDLIDAHGASGGPAGIIAEGAEEALGTAHRVAGSTSPQAILSALPVEDAGDTQGQPPSALEHAGDLLAALEEDGSTDWAALYRAGVAPMDPRPTEPAGLEDPDRALALELARAQPGPDPLEPLPAWPSFETAVEALRAAGNTPTSQEADQLSTAPAQLREAIVTVLEAYVFLQEATTSALDADPTDVGLMRAARDAAAEEIFGVLDVLEAFQDKQLNLGDCGDPVVIKFFTRDSTTRTETVADCDANLRIGGTGNETYRTSAGGADGASNRTKSAAILIDIDGDDAYIPSPDHAAGNGAAIQGVGMLFDLAGNDDYQATFAGEASLNGAANTGAALLYDGGGDDVYQAVVGAQNASAGGTANGAAVDGAALLYDASGIDVYNATVAGAGAANGAAFAGTGALLDESGADTYQASIAGTGAANGAAANATLPILGNVPNASSMNIRAPSSMTAIGDSAGTLFDGGEADTYNGSVGSGAVNGAAGDGLGLIVDGSGADTYQATLGHGAANGAGVTGIGQLVDRSESDTYEATLGHGAANGAGLFGLGLLVDESGGDAYLVDASGDATHHGAAHVGVGILADGVGSNRFQATGASPLASLGAARGLAVEAVPDNLAPATVGAPVLGLPDSVGLLVGGVGDDVYESAGLTQGAGGLGGLGVLVDPGGNDLFKAGANSTAQGAGQDIGTGLLVETGGNATFTLGDASEGQGAGLMGVGLLARPDATRAASYQVAPDADATSATGAGVGLVIDRATASVAERVPTTCPDGDGLTPLVDVPGVARVTVCPPGDTTRRAIPHPLTGEPMEPTDKESFDCGSETDLDPACASLPRGLDRWLKRDNATSTLSGGLQVVLSEGGMDSLGTPQRPDDVCGSWCMVERFL